METGKKCRICLEENQHGVVSLRELISFDKITISEVYHYVTGFIVSLLSGPQFICSICAEELSTVYQFKKRCERNEKLFEIEVKNELLEPEIDFQTLKINTLKVENFESASNFNDGIIKEEAEGILKKHLNKRNQKVDLFHCPYCDKICNTKHSISQHCVSDHSEKKIKCFEENCSYYYYLKFQLEKHIKIKHDPMKFEEKNHHSCPNCDKTFEKKSQLNKHRNEVHDIKSINIMQQAKEMTICPHCGKNLKFSSLASHIEIIHKKSDAGVYICDFCGNNYNSRMSIANHLRYQHMKKSAIICRYCPETFANNGSRRYHEVTIHTKNYRHICSICGMKCYNSAIFKRHMISHTGEKNYICPKCGARFGRKSTLNNHIATHTDIKSYICKTCNAAFKTIKSLKTHQHVHEERKYECPVCSQKFLVNQSMRIHCTKTHPDYQLPPPGTVMNKQAIKRIQEITQRRPSFESQFHKTLK